MLKQNLSRRDFFGASALGAVAGASILSNPVRAAAESVGAKVSDLPDLTIKEVKVYVANIGPVMRRINTTETGEIVSIVTNSGHEGNYTLGNRVIGTGWLDYAKELCVGKNVLDLLPSLAAITGPRTRGFATPFVGGFGYPNGLRLSSAAETNYHAAIIDVCLWDILGKAVNRPIYKLLGGTKDKMLAYGSSLHLANLEDFAPQAVEAKGQGFKAYKIHPGNGQHPTGARSRPITDTSRRSARSARPSARNSRSSSTRSSATTCPRPWPSAACWKRIIT